MIWHYILAWFPMILIAIINAGIRELVYAKYFGELRAHQISTVTGILLFGLYVWILTRLQHIQSTEQALVIGLIWLLLTVSFEFLFGHYIVGLEWSQLLADYNLLAGRVWIFVLVWIAIAPLVFFSLQNQV
ncbi:MAG: hypothetical protein SAK29_16200 [Scytonema sp. PMC 1069.18]|nr:hypothetical protein [Scytonema sp. PMC 1069.18]MEC4883038.1 hypothetical protein [Scytonema sp. PMC 1070.18]